MEFYNMAARKDGIRHFVVFVFFDSMTYGIFSFDKNEDSSTRIFVDPNIHWPEYLSTWAGGQMSPPQALGSSQRPDLSPWLGYIG
jgi:hypothetical protein